MEFELKNFEDKINDITDQFMSLLDSNKSVGDTIKTRFDEPASNSEGIFRFEDMGGVENNENSIPSHAIRFDDADELNKRLEALYNERRYNDSSIIKEPKLAFADYGLGLFNNNVTTANEDSKNVNLEGELVNTNNAGSNNTNDKLYSKNDKEANQMANYEYNVNDDNSIFSFATIPQDRALAPQRTFSDVLFMDIPWDTKIDIWGSIKAFLNTDIKITF